MRHRLDLALPRHLDQPHPSPATAVTFAAQICRRILALPVAAVKIPVARTKTTQAPKMRPATKARLMSPAMPTPTVVTMMMTPVAAGWTTNPEYVPGLNILLAKPLVRTPPPLPP